jgi:hypothetical protein
MSESRQTQIPKSKTVKKRDADEDVAPSSTIPDEAAKQKLKELDEFMEGVLQEAGQEFLDEFKQVEGE